MARTDAIVLGAGIVGTSAALHLAKRGLSVAMVDRRAPGEETSYGNTGIIEGNTLFPHAFPSGFGNLLRIALKQAPEANYHLSFLPKVAPWLLAYRSNTGPEGSLAFAEAMRPLFSRAVSEHETLMTGAGATRYLRKDGWIKLYRSDAAFEATARERDYAEKLGLKQRALNVEQTRALEPSLNPVFRHAVHWPEAASVSNPLAVTKAYAARFAALGGVVLSGDALTLHRSDSRCGARAVGTRPARPSRHRSAARLQARLSPALRAARQRRLDAADRRCRQWLLPGADGAGHSPHHRRGVRGPRREADPRAVRPADGRGARAVSVG
jgi:D-lysine oxidase